jgi:hypothetical protein
MINEDKSVIMFNLNTGGDVWEKVMHCRSIKISRYAGLCGAMQDQGVFISQKREGG